MEICFYSIRSPMKSKNPRFGPHHQIAKDICDEQKDSETREQGA